MGGAAAPANPSAPLLRPLAHAQACFAQGLKAGLDAINQRRQAYLDRASTLAQHRALVTEEALTTLLLACATAAVMAQPALVGLGSGQKPTAIHALKRVRRALEPWQGCALVAGGHALAAAHRLAKLTTADEALGCVARATRRTCDAGAHARRNHRSYNAGQHMRDAVLALIKHKDGQLFFDSVSKNKTGAGASKGTARCQKT